MQMIIIYLSNKNVTCICLRQFGPFFKMELVIWESEFLKVFLLKLRIFQIVLRNLKLH